MTTSITTKGKLNKAVEPVKIKRELSIHKSKNTFSSPSTKCGKWINDLSRVKSRWDRGVTCQKCLSLKGK